MRPLCIDDMISQDHAVVDLVDGTLLVFERTDKSTTENNAHLYYTTKYNAMQVEALQNPESFGTPLNEQFDQILGEISQVADLKFWFTLFFFKSSNFSFFLTFYTIYCHRLGPWGS